MKRTATIVISIFALAMTACQTTEFVVLRDVPKNPTFTVLPANAYLDEVAFARHVEGALIAANVSVLAPPPQMQITQEMTIEADEVAGGSGAAAARSAEAKQTTKFWAYDHLSSTYVVTTMHTYARRYGQVRIEIRETREVVAAFEIYRRSDETGPNKILQDAVDALLQRGEHAGQEM